MFQEREYLEGMGVDVVDFSMQDPRNLPSPYAADFVRNQSYRGDKAGAVRGLLAGVKMVHSREATRRLAALIDRTRPDLMHCHNIYHQLTPSIIGTAKRRGVPVVLTLHDYKPVCPVYTRLQAGEVCSRCQTQGDWPVVRHRCQDGSLAKSAILYLEARVQRLLKSYELVDRVVAPSRFMKTSVSPYRFQEDRVDVVYNGVDTAGIEARSEEGGYALYMGRLSHEKGIKTLLEAHAEIADSVDLVVAGTGPLEAELKERFPQPRFVGHVTGEALAGTIRGAAMIVIPSEWYENCPMSVLEAMAYGKPVLASRIGGIPELVEHERTGLLHSPGDRDALRNNMLRLAKDHAQRIQYGQAGRRRAEERFSLAAHNEQLMQIYQTVVGQKLRPDTDGIPNDLVTRQE